MNVPEQKHRRRKSQRHEKSILREFTMEIIIGILFLLGIFLLLEEMEIKTYIFHGIVSFFQAITNGFSNSLGAIIGTVDIIETSDIVGTLLILVAFFLIMHRVRQKAIIRLHELSACPDCGGDLLHIHKNYLQRLTSKIFRLKIRRYHCKSCEFEGLRIRAVKLR